MKAHAHIDDPDNVQITLTITMSLKQWREAAERLRGHSHLLSRFVQELVQKVTHKSISDLKTEE